MIVFLEYLPKLSERIAHFGASLLCSFFKPSFDSSFWSVSLSFFPLLILLDFFLSSKFKLSYSSIIPNRSIIFYLSASLDYCSAETFAGSDEFFAF